MNSNVWPLSKRWSKKFIPTPIALFGREVNGTGLNVLNQRLVGHRFEHSQSLYKRDLLGHFGCVNAIEFSNDGELIASGGDDRRLLIWNISRVIFDGKSPNIIDTQHTSNINTCCFDATNRLVTTGGNDGMVITHDINQQEVTSSREFEAAFCLSADPVNSTNVAVACDDGKIHILDSRLPGDALELASCGSAMHSVQYSPVEPRVLASANAKTGVQLWDLRRPHVSLNYKSSVSNCMSVRFNQQGDRLLALRRRASPCIFDVLTGRPLHQFDYASYYNSCTLKSCCFAGINDEYVITGSDDFCIYLWKVPSDPSQPFSQEEPHMILKGHRSIVNQVRYCPVNQMIISSGVEKLIKMWSPYYIPGSTGSLLHSRRYGDDEELERNAYSHEEYIHMVLMSDNFLSHDYTNGSTAEDPCMIAFFDSLIQREVANSPTDLSDSEDQADHGWGDAMDNLQASTSGGDAMDNLQASTSGQAGTIDRTLERAAENITDDIASYFTFDNGGTSNSTGDDDSGSKANDSLSTDSCSAIEDSDQSMVEHTTTPAPPATVITSVRIGRGYTVECSTVCEETSSEPIDVETVSDDVVNATPSTPCSSSSLKQAPGHSSHASQTATKKDSLGGSSHPIPKVQKCTSITVDSPTGLTSKAVPSGSSTPSMSSTNVSCSASISEVSAQSLGASASGSCSTANTAGNDNDSDHENSILTPPPNPLSTLNTSQSIPLQSLLQSSGSDSDSEIDEGEILRAMYTQYMSARDRAFSRGVRPSGKKISSVIAMGKQRDRAHSRRKLLKGDKSSNRTERPTGLEQNMGILADIVDNVVDTLSGSSDLFFEQPIIPQVRIRDASTNTSQELAEASTSTSDETLDVERSVASSRRTEDRSSKLFHCAGTQNDSVDHQKVYNDQTTDLKKTTTCTVRPSLLRDDSQASTSQGGTEEKLSSVLFKKAPKAKKRSWRGARPKVDSSSSEEDR